MTTNYLINPKNLLEKLLERDCVLLEVGVPDAKNFGNEYQILRCNAILIRLVVDRGQFFVDIASLEKPHAWYDVALILHMIGENQKEVLSADEKAHYLYQNLEKISKLFARPNQNCLHEALKRERKIQLRRHLPELSS